MRLTRAIAPSRSLLPPAILPVALVLFLLVGIGQNSALALLSLVVLTLGGALLWRPGEAPIFLLIFGYQWLQASARIFHANAKGVDVTDLSYAGGQVALASVLSLLALLALAVGLRAGAGRWRADDARLCRAQALQHGIPKWFRLYALTWAGGMAALFLVRVAPGLSQLLLAAAALRWAFFWMLAYATFLRPAANRSYFLIAFGLEFVMGIGGYFADFKTVFFMTILALAASGARISARQMLGLSVLSAAMLLVGIAWTAVKVDYRYYVSGGGAGQIVAVGNGERLSYLTDLVGNLSGGDLVEATDKFVNRISYVDFFAVVLDTVPASVAHEDGALWWDALRRPFMPRIFFPGKSVIDDSERTNLYTGLGVSGAAAGTSISIGYVGESYIDFGEIGMMLVILLYGLLLGRTYRWFLQGSRSRGLLGMALMTSMLVNIAPMESSITKVVGGVAVSLLAAWLLVRYLVPAFFPWLRFAASH